MTKFSTPRKNNSKNNLRVKKAQNAPLKQRQVRSTSSNIGRLLVLTKTTEQVLLTPPTTPTNRQPRRTIAWASSYFARKL